jgi:hypothetical protein
MRDLTYVVRALYYISTSTCPQRNARQVINLIQCIAHRTEAGECHPLTNITLFCTTTSADQERSFEI